MKTLLIMRHAKSSWKEAGQTDHDRPLNRRGEEAAPCMGELLASEQLTPDVILCSTANRAQQTCQAVIKSAGWSIEPTSVPQLYLASPSTICSCLSELPPSINTAMVIAHNPGLTELVQELTGQIDHLPTGAIAHITLPIDDWTRLSGPLKGELAHFWTPKGLD